MTTARDQATLGRAIQDRFPRYYRYFSTDGVQLSRPVDPQPQSPARQCRGRRRHQDRLHPRVGLQSRDLDAPRQPPSGRRGAGRPQRRFARRHHAQPARRKSREGRDQAHRCRDHRAQCLGRQCRCCRSRRRIAADADGSGPGRRSGRIGRAGRGAAGAFDRTGLRDRSSPPLQRPCRCRKPRPNPRR